MNRAWHPLGGRLDLLLVGGGIIVVSLHAVVAPHATE